MSVVTNEWQQEASGDRNLSPTTAISHRQPHPFVLPFIITTEPFFSSYMGKNKKLLAENAQLRAALGQYLTRFHAFNPYHLRL